MAQDQILITNLTSGQLALALKFGERVQVQKTIAPGASLDVSTVTTLAQLNLNPTIQSLLASGDISVSVVSGTSNVPGLVTDAEVRARTGFPILDQLVSGASGLSIAAIPAAFTLKGRNFLTGQTKASLVSGTGTSSVTVTANRPGTYGNLISVVLVDAGSTSVSVSGGALTGESTIARTITVNFRGATHSNTDKATDVAALINGNATAKKLVHAVGGGSGNVAALAATHLSGGTGTGFKLYIGSLEQDIIDNITSTQISAQTAALTGYANTDMANITVLANSTYSFPMPVEVVT